MEEPSQAAKLAPPASQRLDSWKDIAAHLQRSVRTVQRWEKEEGLPVYRHLHSKRGSIYAYQPELDAWWNNHRAVLELEVENDRLSFLRTHKTLLWVSFAILLLALAGSAWWAKEKLLKSQKAVLPFQERDWVLVARFENRTGQTLFDGTLEYALERELSNSRYVNVVPRERIEDALRLMKKPLKTAIDAALGREICLRDGNIQALVAGRVEKLGSAYVLSAQLMDAARGVVVASRSEEALGEKAIPAAIRSLSNWVREKVGEQLPLIEHDRERLEKVTTPSLRALRLFTKADVLLHQRQPAPSAELLKAALKEDPEFAAAHMWMAWAIQNQGKPAAEYLPYAERALQLSGSTSERERYLIEAKYYSIRGEAEKAIPVYEALLRLYPDDYWGMNNLLGAYRTTNRLPEAMRLSLRRAELHPNNFAANWTAAYNLSVVEGDVDRAEPYVKRAHRLMSGEANAFQTSWIHFFPLRKSWLQGNLPKTVSELTRLLEAAKSYSAETQGAFLSSAAHLYLVMGKVRAAEELFQNDFDLAVAAFAKGDAQSLRRRLQIFLDNVKNRTQLGPAVVLLLVRSGLIVEARRALSVLEKQGFPEAYVKIIQGELALTQGKAARGRTLLTDGVGKLQKTGTGSFFLGSESLSTACIRQGDLETARRTLEQASGERVQAAFFGSSLTFWMGIQVKLAEIYRKLGRQGDAERIEKELLSLLADADPDYSLARSLKAVAKTRPSK